MPDTLRSPWAPPLDSSRLALEFIHRLLVLPSQEQTNLDALLEELSTALGASAAGLATFPEGVPLSVHPPSSESPSVATLPWCEQPDLIERLLAVRDVLVVPRSAGGSCLITVLGTPERGAWLLWLEDAGRSRWSVSEESLLTMVGQALTHRLTRQESLSPWVVQLDRALRQHRMDAASRIVRRLAHDFGNILTGILGFSELSLTLRLAPSSPLHTYLTEIHRGAQNGAQYTNQLRLIARRQATNNRCCNLDVILSEEKARLTPALGTRVLLRLDLPADLPAAAVEAESLRQVLAIVLDNAGEAIVGPGSIEVSVRVVQLNFAEARELFGEVHPGTHLEIRVADSGGGLSAEARRQLFADPFFSTKPRKRGFGLAMAYGLLAAHHGGIELQCRPEGGTIARLVLPTVGEFGVSSVMCSGTGIAPVPPAARKERVLVVDDDPMILHLITTTLDRAGYRVQAASTAAEALKNYSAAPTDPFRLVLSDILMPDVNGFELVRQLRARDTNVSVLFMSGQVFTEGVDEAFVRGRFELLTKPFRPEGLLRAVRAALDRSIPTPQEQV